MSVPARTHRLAAPADLDELRALGGRPASVLQAPFLSSDQVEASRTIMGLDTQLITDQTYFVVEARGRIVGCGGWRRRAALYGGNQTPGRDPELLDPARHAARVRAMYTHPAHVRQGIGRSILTLCEDAA